MEPEGKDEPDEYPIEGVDYPIKCASCGVFIAKAEVYWEHELGDYGTVLGGEPYCPKHKTRWREP